MARAEERRIAIIGAGPVGLEAALYARKLRFPVTLYERGRVGEHIERWGHVRLFSPFGMNSTSLGRAAIHESHAQLDLPAEDDCLTGREHLEAYLRPLAETGVLGECLRQETQVLQIGRRGCLKEDAPDRERQPFCLLVREGKNRERLDEAEIILDCSGTYARHRWMGDGGIPAVGEEAAAAQMAYGLEDVCGGRQGHYAGKTVLLVGGGHSAATTACALAALAENHPDTWVVWLARGRGTQPIVRFSNDPLRERDRLAVRANTLATRGDANLEFHNQSVIEAIEFLGQDRGFRVAARTAGSTRQWEVDRIVANVGYSPDTALYRELRVQECYATLGPAGLAAALRKQGGESTGAVGAAVLRNPEPNFFILGSKSYGRNSRFLMRTGFEQIRDVFRLITAKGDLDLYSNSARGSA